MSNEATDRQTHAITGNALSRDFQWITFTAVIANSVTLYLVSSETEAKLAVSAVIITTLLFALIAGLNQMDMFKNWIDDMDEKDISSNLGKFLTKAPFGMWKGVYSVTFVAIAVTQLYDLWN
ncbi:MAG: hypothetical protein VYE27_04555 [Pseudomonadota bacterium]|nr:hypothetical protein [Pseudomonadota bacterium]